MTLTLQNFPEELNAALRERAEAEGKTLDQVAMEVLRAGLASSGPRRRDLSDLVGTWADDPEFDALMKEQDRIDWEMWK